jgi:hypothetical protein
MISEDETPTPMPDNTPVEAVQVAEANTPAEQPEVEAEPTPREPRTAFTPNDHVTLTREFKEPLTEKTRAKFTRDENLSIIAATIQDLATMIENTPKIEPGRGEEGQRWAETMDRGEELLYRGGALAGALDRLTSMWQQHVDYKGEKIAMGRPRFGENLNSGENELLTGERAKMKMMAAMGLGATIQVPLWHTGIWVTMKAPKEADLLELDRRIALEKVTLGRYTNGMIYSNNSVYSASFLFRFALQHVYDSNLKDIKMDTLLSTIKITDIPTLIWGLACTIYTNGYPFSQACYVDPSVCQHVTEELLNLSKLYWQDDRLFTEFQRKHMANRNVKVTAEALERYQEEMSFNELSTFTLGDGAMTVRLKVPSLQEYEQSGFEWVDTIVRQTDAAFGEELRGDQRNLYIINQAKVSSLRQYGHWVEKLVITDGGIVAGRTEIEEAVELLSSNDDVLTEFLTGIGKFIDDCTLAMIAIPKYDCPKCGQPMPDEAKLHPNLIPLDMMRIFFTLLDQRVIKVVSRSAM